MNSVFLLNYLTCRWFVFMFNFFRLRRSFFRPFSKHCDSFICGRMEMIRVEKIVNIKLIFLRFFSKSGLPSTLYAWLDGPRWHSVALRVRKLVLFMWIWLDVWQIWASIEVYRVASSLTDLLLPHQRLFFFCGGTETNIIFLFEVPVDTLRRSWGILSIVTAIAGSMVVPMVLNIVNLGDLVQLFQMRFC